jgi:hypothetical protein
MQEELTKILKTMDLPFDRLNANIPANCRWLLSNMGIRNSNNPDYEKAKRMLKELNKKHQEKVKANG